MASFVAASALGAMARHRVNLLGRRWVGTLGVNVVGSFLLGWLVAAEPADGLRTVVGVGFLGTLTTFSMFALEATEGPARHRITVVASTMLICLVAATLGASID